MSRRRGRLHWPINAYGRLPMKLTGSQESHPKVRKGQQWEESYFASTERSAPGNVLPSLNVQILINQTGELCFSGVSLEKGHKKNHTQFQDLCMTSSKLHLLLETSNLYSKKKRKDENRNQNSTRPFMIPTGQSSRSVAPISGRSNSIWSRVFPSAIALWQAPRACSTLRSEVVGRGHSCKVLPGGACMKGENGFQEANRHAVTGS